jgi:predicted nucleic acid-binding protein
LLWPPKKSARRDFLVQAQLPSQRLQHREDHSFHAPDIFGWEVENILLARARRTSGFDLDLILGQLASLNIELAPPMTAHDRVASIRAAQAASLSLSDTVYLGLALELGAELGSRDLGLLAAARRYGVTVRDLTL